MQSSSKDWDKIFDFSQIKFLVWRIQGGVAYATQLLGDVRSLIIGWNRFTISDWLYCFLSGFSVTRLWLSIVPPFTVSRYFWWWMLPNRVLINSFFQSWLSSLPFCKVFLERSQASLMEHRLVYVGLIILITRSLMSLPLGDFPDVFGKLAGALSVVTWIWIAILWVVIFKFILSKLLTHMMLE